MKKSVLFSAALLSFSCIGLISALFKNRTPEPVLHMEKTIVEAEKAMSIAPQDSSVLPVPASSKMNAPSEKSINFLHVFPKKTLPFSVGREELLPLFQQESLHALIFEEWLPEEEPKKTPEQMAAEKAKRDTAWKTWKKADKIHPVIRTIVDGSQIEYFSRVPSLYEPIALLENESYYAAVFSRSRGFEGLYRQYFVATFDKSGNPVSDRLIGRAYPEDMVTFRIDRQLQVLCQEHTIRWAKDFEAHGTDDNTVAGTDVGRIRYIDLTKQQSRQERQIRRSVRLIFKEKEDREPGL